MNNAKRKELKSAIDIINLAQRKIEEVMDEEQYSLDNMPENLESSNRYADMENSIDNMEDAISGLDLVVDSIEEAMQ